MFHMKTCPTCGAELFSDMDVCYECLGVCEDSSELVPVQVYAEAASATASPGDEASRDKGWSLRMHTSIADATILVPKNGLVIGRGSSCDVVLHTPAVSRRHVRVVPSESCLVASDLGATNRATVGEVPVENNTELQDGEELRVCGATFEALRGT